MAVRRTRCWTRGPSGARFAPSIPPRPRSARVACLHRAARTTIIRTCAGTRSPARGDSMDGNPLLRLASRGQSVWLDDIHRRILNDGTLARMIEEDGLAGLTSNPAIFAKSIMKDSEYAAPVAQLVSKVSSSLELYEAIVIDDIRRAADVFRPVWERTQGADGFASLEVSPHLARDTAATIAEARRLWGRLERDNVMIKVPGTREGIPAIRTLIVEGINVNVTLLFSPERYELV